jgi:undecaprenyl-diphosphatase
MTLWESFFLGLIQGVTEFLPVSSSGHLELAQYFLGFRDLSRYTLFNLICHLGTLGSIFYVFFPQIKRSLTTKKNFLQVVVGTLPLVPLVFFLKPLKSLFDQPQYLGFCFLISSFLIFAGTYYHFGKRKNIEKSSLKDSLAIGMFQALAILPGISRSGATISAARLLGWKKEAAVSYSFMLAIPAILGGVLIEIVQLYKLPVSEAAFLHAGQFLMGFLTSFGVGCASLKFLIRMSVGDKWVYFAWYCLAIGVFTILYFNVVV